MSAGNGNGRGGHSEHAPNRMAALIEREQAALKDRAEYADTYAPLDRNSFRALGKRLEEPLDVVPPFLPALAAACRSWGGGKGWAKGWNVVMGARTGHGKSIFGGMVATHAAEHGIRAAIHSTEMEFEDNQLRVLAQCTGTELWKLEPGAQFIRHAFDRAVREFEERSQGRLILNKLRHRTLPAVLDGMRRSWEYDGCELHVIDYVQLMATGVKGYYSEDINARMSEISYGIVLTTEDLGLVSVSLSQFNRDGIRSAQRPEPYMLMGGSALENDAKQILLMDHTRTIDAEGGDASWLLIGKSRIGPAGPRFDIPIHRSHKNLRIRERLSDEVDESELFNPHATAKRKL